MSVVLEPTAAHRHHAQCADCDRDSVGNPLLLVPAIWSRSDVRRAKETTGDEHERDQPNAADEVDPDSKRGEKLHVPTAECSSCERGRAERENEAEYKAVLPKRERRASKHRGAYSSSEHGERRDVRNPQAKRVLDRPRKQGGDQNCKEPGRSTGNEVQFLLTAWRLFDARAYQTLLAWSA